MKLLFTSAVAFVLGASVSSAHAVQALSVELATRDHPTTSLTYTTHAPGQVVDTNATPKPVWATPKAQRVLNCENDYIIDGAHTLVIGDGDRAGNIFEMPTDLTPPLKVASATMGLLNFGQTLPTVVELDIFQDNGAGSFEFVAGFDVTVDSIDNDGSVVEVDLTSFDLEVSGRVLTLFGDANPSPAGRVLPAGDGTARCLSSNNDNICSVHLPQGATGVFIYGAVDPASCASSPNNILNFDLVHELVIVDANGAVATSSESWGTVKSRF